MNSAVLRIFDAILSFYEWEASVCYFKSDFLRGGISKDSNLMHDLVNWKDLHAIDLIKKLILAQIASSAKVAQHQMFLTSMYMLCILHENNNLLLKVNIFTF